MWNPQPTSAPLPRRVVLAALVCCQLSTGVGFVVPTRSGKDTSRPFPCMSRPCGCLTYEQCWAGDCCCFTLGEKLAWAEANRIVPPAHARTSAAKASCCRPKADECKLCTPDETGTPADDLSARWVDGLSALRCKGHPLAGWWATTPALPPEFPVTWTFEWTAAGALPVVDLIADIVPSLPTEPPPRR